MKRSPACDALVKKWEGYHRALPDGSCAAYPDVATGGEPWTIGFGTTRYLRDARKKFGRSKVRKGDVLTRAEAEAELDAELDEVEDALNDAIGVRVTQGMFDALVSFAFNLGVQGAEAQLRRINRWEFEECARSFDLYIMANGRPFQGLINRRNEEEALFRSQGLEPSKPEPLPSKPDSLGRPYAPCPVPVPWTAWLARRDDGNVLTKGLDVYHLQCALIGLGYLAKPKDGELVGDVFNEHVQWAVVRFQRDTGDLADDGIVGPKTRAAIEAALTKARKPKPAPSPAGKATRCEFVMDAGRSSALRAGTLSFYDDAGHLVRKEPATSGLPGYQDESDVWTRGAGPIPPVPNLAIRFGDGYHLDTRGIDGWAFPMLPDPIMRGAAVGRSEIMLHRDANVPGTAGCIGLLLTKHDYDLFVSWANKLGTLPLKVRYV